ncbi:hypothetical protein RXV95_01580 [Novosphingobium sp. ZN18A2]|uniref:hypothetical protein n=1 Tax=Novosphingobium sp. ZN18A2 TaxID=3079861 RepID=UPI0030D04E1C
MTRAIPKSALLAALAASALVSACGKDKSAPDAAQSAAAGGEVLPGTVSDAMIDLDGSKSQAPLAPRKAEKDAPPSAEDKQAAQEAVDEAIAPATPATGAPATGANQPQAAGSDVPTGD